MWDSPQRVVKIRLIRVKCFQCPGISSVLRERSLSPSPPPALSLQCGRYVPQVLPEAPVWNADGTEGHRRGSDAVSALPGLMMWRCEDKSKILNE